MEDILIDEISNSNCSEDIICEITLFLPRTTNYFKYLHIQTSLLLNISQIFEKCSYNFISFQDCVFTFPSIFDNFDNNRNNTISRRYRVLLKQFKQRNFGHAYSYMLHGLGDVRLSAEETTRYRVPCRSSDFEDPVEEQLCRLRNGKTQYPIEGFSKYDTVVSGRCIKRRKMLHLGAIYRDDDIEQYTYALRAKQSSPRNQTAGIMDKDVGMYTMEKIFSSGE